MSNANYTLDLGLNTNFTTSVAYGVSSSAITATVSASFSPASSIASVEISDVTILNTDGKFFGVGTNYGSLPIDLTNSAGSSQVVTLSCIYDNTALHADNTVVTNPRFYLDMAAATLNPAASADTLIDPASATYFIDAGDSPSLTALGDAGAPSGVTGFSTANAVNAVNLTWTNPADSDLSGVLVQRSLTVAPSSSSEGTRVTTVIAPSASYSDTGLTGGLTYYYSLFTLDNVGEINETAVSATGVPLNNIPGALPGETLLQTRSRFIDEGII